MRLSLGRPRRRVLVIAAAVCALTATVAYAQFGRGGFFGFGAGRIAKAEDFDHRYITQQVAAHKEADILFRGYDRNRLYIGVRATY